MTSKQSLTAARWAVLIMFFINGASFANFVARIPEFQSRFDLTAAQLGLTLMGGSVGVLSALTFTSSLVARFGSRAVTIFGAVGLYLALPLIAVMPHPIALWVALFLLGMFMTMMDVAMNAQGVEVERGLGKPVMSSFHGAWSIGAAVGAAMGAGTVSLHMPALIHFSIATMIFLTLGLIGSRWLLHVEGEQGERQPPFQIPPRVLWPLGAIAFCSGIGEGSMGDWSAVYLTKVLNSSPALAAMGFTTFTTAMTIGRLSGDWITERLNRVLVVRVGGLVAGVGLLAAMLFPSIPSTFIGFTAMGIGLANVIPLAYSASGRVPGISPSQGISGVATIGYGAFLAGPPLVGALAQATSYRIALGLVAVIVLAIFVFANAIASTERASQVVVAEG